ncbi:hypothetical protein CCACVL1_22730 [Corchorus capsularis]|uniref:Protein kinase domain-containing protein n=1 Tax=Corchorus capsularis TaxID=210143 RepID=A0A1R3GWY8_COCAP|nr:hypothetical protein CCACVL1_22730 [Corchorus capsularis]
MSLSAVTTQSLIPSKILNFRSKNPQDLFSKTLKFYTFKSPTHSNSLHSQRVNSVHPKSPSTQTHHHPIQELLLLLAFSLTLLCFRLLSNALLPDLPLRWQSLIAFSHEAEAQTRAYPKHLWEAIVAYEDRRFFRHFGLDPIGIGRAVLSFSARGGGSTITQQVSVFCLRGIFYAHKMFDGFTQPKFIYPNFSASYFNFIDKDGTFLFSRNGTFKAAIYNPEAQTNFYLCVIHVESNTIIWSANRDSAISNTGKMNLTPQGISIADGNVKWSTPKLQAAVYALLLTEMGNLILLDQFNGSLWESFHHPTDTIVIGQHLPVGANLSNSVSDNNLSTGDYRFMISASDAISQWHGQAYWKLSMDTKAYVNSNFPVEYMAINKTGLYLFGLNGSVVVIQVKLSQTNFRIAKLDASGLFTVSSFSGGKWVQEFVGPIDGCQIPTSCGKMGLCTSDSTSGAPVCSCPSDFHSASQTIGGCLPKEPFYSLPTACDSINNVSESNSSAVSFLRVGSGIDYFSLVFSKPIRYGVDFSVCQDLCSGDCACLGIFYENSSASCYVLKDHLGSLILRNTIQSDFEGYVKVLVRPSATDSSGNQRKEFPLVALVLLPFTGFFLLAALGFLWWKRYILDKTGEIKLGHLTSVSSGDLDTFYIPGLPQKFDYEELEVATDNFKTQIGAGGFGAVYKGTLPDKTVVAVKKITNPGIQGKKEFCTEIAVIGNIHHVNLVKLRGFCAQGRQRFLVYEYMNRGSLDRTLFGSGPVLEWQERFDIALGAARGLAYLHSGCEHKIIHCDVKPENILLHDHFQAKISDFGLSKLLSPEQSSLFTTMRGTRGYLAPEWLTNSAISEKTDVYSFGMVLLELVSGRKNCSLKSQSHSIIDTNSGGGNSSSSSVTGLVYFPLFALEMHEQGRYLELADSRLEGRVTSKEVEKLVRIALCCVHEEPALRPSMATAVGMLEGSIPLGQPRVESLNFLRFYGRRFTEASMIEEENGQILLVHCVRTAESFKGATLLSVALDQLTINMHCTHNLVKNTFLKNERTFSRKILEMILALALERTLSKHAILSSYVCKIYWGHGINGIESASTLYFGKHPSLLSLAEAAMLAGLIPAPELRSPLRDERSGKIFQARVLKRMVEVGAVDMEMALLTVRQPLYLHSSRPEYTDALTCLLSFSDLGLRENNKLSQVGKESRFKGTWDWERESKIWEVCEEMERWAMKFRCRTSAKASCLKGKTQAFANL